MVTNTTGLPTEVIRQLEALEKAADDIIDEMLDAGVDAVKPEVEKKLKTAITGEYATGELEKSIAVKSKSYKDGAKARVIYFKGTTRVQRAKNGKVYKRKKAVRLNEIAAVLEYGKSDQPPRAFMRPAFNAKQESIAKAMEDKFEELTKKYQN